MPSYTCSRCHKPIVDPTSVENGFGPACFAYVKKTIEEKQGVDPLLTFLHGEINNPDIILSRDNIGNACTNVRQFVARHSATGFDWGNNEGGATDLAYNILLRFGMPRPVIDSCYKNFRMSFIEKIPYAGGVIEAGIIQKYME